MAQIQADRPMSGAARGYPAPIQANMLSKLTYGLASVISLGLVIGVGVWGYKLMVRDVSGVPVIRAAEGPMRIQPEEPGGRQAANQGLSVNDVAAIGAVAAAPDELILAPAPLDLTLEDDPGPERVQPTSLQTQTQSGVVPEQPQEAAAPAPDSATAAAQGTGQGTDEAAMLALAEALSAGVTPLGEVAPAPNIEVSAPVTGGIGRSLRPRERPQGLQTASLSVVEPLTAETAAQEVSAAQIPTGTRLAQLGAFTSEAIAREEWTRLEARFDEYLVGKTRVIQRAESGGRTFYRLRAMGFEDLVDARRFCSALVAEQAECIPVVTR